MKIYKDLWEKPKKQISEEWFNTASDNEIKRFIIGFNDGQGDHSFYTFEGILALLSESDLSSNKSIDEMTNIEILDEFYNGCQLTGNNSDMVYFNGEEYQEVEWIV